MALTPLFPQPSWILAGARFQPGRQPRPRLLERLAVVLYDLLTTDR
jgi:hypothetical protein